MTDENGVKVEMHPHGGEKIDPVCGMDLSAFEGAVRDERGGRARYFCSAECRARFLADPEKFSGRPFIMLHGIEKEFGIGGGATRVLRGVNLHIWEGDFVAIIGASGSGKSTLLNMIGLLDKPSAGQVFFDGRDVAALDDEERAALRSKTFGFVFQQYNLIPWFSAYENVVLPLVFAGKEGNRSALAARIGEVGLTERMTHHPAELSGGEQQRVALLRALANDPRIVLGDEPTGNLDSETGNKILELLIRLNRNEKKTLIVVTHDVDIAEKADQIVAIKDGQIVRNHKVYKKIYTE